MVRLLQIVGPMACGKTMLLRSLCPEAIRAGYMHSMFNGWLLEGDKFVFEELYAPREIEKLEHWCRSDRLLIHKQYAPSITIPNNKLFIWSGIEPLPVKCPTLVWEVNKWLPM